MNETMNSFFILNIRQPKVIGDSRCHNCSSLKNVSVDFNELHGISFSLFLHKSYYFQSEIRYDSHAKLLTEILDVFIEKTVSLYANISYI